MTTFNAAVLALLDASVRPCLLVTVRATHMRTHAGQISLPGGGKNNGETPTETALRETWEEVGILPADIEIRGQLSAFIAPRTGHKVIPIIGQLDKPHSHYSLQLNPSEVASAHWIALADLADRENRGTWQRVERTGPGFQLDELMIWGFTAQIIDRLLAEVGAAQPWDVSRILAIPQRFDFP
ncbi:NUDIX hydrolase [Arcanobacterium buesumense]|uniref:CoA pyrophosphatase n=1 Tax=Arcanobacterium buesumense TaxID=2722751 RepID=A0A6H2EJ87_9ACTO|nr:CoA pyrophosphatase [Arcanobacterium buesumense]QJC21204.1 CoA pyrophosphatase [Arcanobacterium buesumense]